MRLHREPVIFLAAALVAAGAVTTTACQHGQLGTRGGYPAARFPAVPSAGDTKVYLDIHRLGPGAATLAQIEAAHAKDLAVQKRHGVIFTSYWFDQKNGRVYCLSRARDADAPNRVHREAHGGVAHEVIEVTEGH
jgi:hypothetical protein